MIGMCSNLGKYDMHLCLEAFYSHNIQAKLLTRGMKMYQMRVRNRTTIIFKDSLNFFFAPLAALRSAYQLEDECEEKPHFPHLYTRRENLFIERDTLPELEYYDAGRMMPKERDAHIKWHKDNINTPWNLARELVSYCLNDVALLRAACLKFRQVFLESEGVDPFVVANTIAKLAQVVYFKCYMPPRTIINAPEKVSDDVIRMECVTSRLL
jgi:DNA polymerase type B, organellar and viral